MNEQESNKSEAPKKSYSAICDPSYIQNFLLMALAALLCYGALFNVSQHLERKAFVAALVAQGNKGVMSNDSGDLHYITPLGEQKVIRQETIHKPNLPVNTLINLSIAFQMILLCMMSKSSERETKD